MIDNANNKNVENKSRLPLYLSVSLFGVLVTTYFLIPEVERFFDQAWSVLTSDDEVRIQQWVSGFGWFGPVLLILAMIAQMFLLVIPSILLMVVTILAYGSIAGSLIVFGSVFAASSVGYFIGRYFGNSVVTGILGKKSQQKVEDFIDNYGFWAVFVTRINPFLSNDAISFVGGLLQMGYWKFIGATLIGIAPLTMYIAITGKSIESLKTGLFWGSLISLLVFGIYVWWDKKGRKN
ncbi:hypothetical protein LCGC14_0673140 [marine sediment metagenome]|uniref:TVP38/TMEM64 family membrane protein n=2 Tax=root TaxID=1 RepID=A0A831VN49_9FLAO|nr:TVP38/TMEM64 family protein [Pricia sp.]HEA21360.1 TVP38/TMEM64 family protein [Pricia antarctica]